MSKFTKRTMTVDGEKVDFNTSVDLPIADLTPDMDKVASQMAWWGSVKASAERELALADAFYRKWRASKTLEITSPTKEPEWRQKAMIESDPKFIEYKSAIATAAENVSLAHAMFESFAKKANILQSRGAHARAEMKAGGMTTPENDPEEDDAPSEQEKRDKLKQIVSKSKKKVK